MKKITVILSMVLVLLASYTAYTQYAYLQALEDLSDAKREIGWFAEMSQFVKPGKELEEIKRKAYDPSWGEF